MKRAKQTFPLVLLLVFIFISMAPPRLVGQANRARPLITERIDTRLTTLKGNTYPLARPEFDRGAVPLAMPMQHLFLVLKRSPEQTAALEKLLAEQQDSASPNYHKWLTPVGFGQQFGPSDQDIQKVVLWLQSHGLQVVLVSNGRSVVEFSGTAAQVQQAFQTEIHNYEVNGEIHWANSSDPRIPTALTPVVAGVAALHNFRPRPLSHIVRLAGRNANGTVKPVMPQFNYPSGCTVGNTSCELAVGPADFAAIYNVNPVYSASIDGTGQTIAVMGQAAIRAADVTDFWTAFNVQRSGGIPTILSLPNDGPQYSLGQDPGNEGESDLDLEWSGAAAPGAAIEFVTSYSVIDSSFCTVEGFPQSQNQLSGAPSNACDLSPAAPPPLPQILSLSYGLCEADLLSSGNTLMNTIWSQAAGEGITVVVATGDEGSASCDLPQGSGAQPATHGLTVNGLASTPYNTAVGGTDFDDLSNLSAYWNLSNSTDGKLESAKGYIPERTYNDSCTNELWNGVATALTSNPEANCNQTTLTIGNISYADFISPYGGGGGASGIYPKPTLLTAGWQQVAPGVPNDGMRDLPDVSLFSGNGLAGSYYVVCQYDSNGGTNSLGNPITAPCSLTSGTFVRVGGTSAATQVFAGIMALVNQKMTMANNDPSYRVGLANSVLYQLAQQQWAAATSCNSSAPASSCVFNDVTKGTISAPCVNGWPNCVVSRSSDLIGILTCCDASTGYDLATGLGSVNVANLVNNWASAAGSPTPDFWLSLSAGNGTVVIPTPGNSGSFGFTVTQVNGFTGTFTDTSIYSCSGLPTLSTCSFAATAVDSTHTSVTVTVSTAATGMMVPANRPKGVGWWTTGGAMSLACVLCIAILLLSLRGKNRRLTTATALLVFAIVLMSAGGCGGGGTTPPPPIGGTPQGFYTPTVTVNPGGGATPHSLNFNLSVR